MKKNIKDNRYFIVTIGIVILTIMFYSILAPFILGVIIAILIEPMVRWIEKMFHIRRNIGAFISMILIFIMLTIILFFFINIIIKELNNILNQWPSVYMYIKELVSYIYEWLEKIGLDTIDQWDIDLEKQLYNSIIIISKNLDHIRSSLIKAFENFSSSLLFCIISIFSTYFFSRDKEYFYKILEENLPYRLFESLKEYIIYIFSFSTKMIKIYMKIICVTMIQTILGLLILRVPFPFLFGILTGIADVLPIIGPGVIFLPWIIYCLLIENYYLAFGLSILFILININGQILQMKLVSKELKIHPLFIIFSIYVGLKIFGITGSVIGPVLLLILKGFIMAGNKKVL